MRFASFVALVLLVATVAALVHRLRSLARAARPVRPPMAEAPPTGTEDGGRWNGRPVLAGLVVATAYVIPVIASVATSAVLSRQLPRPHGWGRTLLMFGLLFTISTVVLVLIERVARRLLPLGALLKLSLAFPDQAPRRLSIARRAASVHDLEARLHKARSEGIEDEPARAAETILTLVGSLHAHDRRTRGHAERVRALTDLLADELRVSPDDRDRLRWAALLHDIGKIHVPAKVLNKPGPPTGHEWHLIRQHPIDGAGLAAPLFDWLGDWSLTIVQHHERWDGTGYPYGLQGEAISYGARIVGVADSFDAMTAARSYQRSRSAAAARRELTAKAGTQFDPAVVRAFLNVSIGRVRWALGPLSWVVQLPFIGWVPRAAEGVVAAGSQAAGVVGTAAGAAVIATTSAVGATTAPIPDSTAPAPAPIVAAVDQPAADAASAAAGGSGTTASRSSGSTSTRAASVAPAPTPVTTTAPTSNGNGNGSSTAAGPSTAAVDQTGASTHASSSGSTHGTGPTLPAADTLTKATGAGAGKLLHGK